jgi:hypothetical protein
LICGVFLFPVHDGHCRFLCCVLHPVLTHGAAYFSVIRAIVGQCKSFTLKSSGR